MSITPQNWSKLHNGNESRQIPNLNIRIAVMNHASKQEQLCSGIQFLPQSMLDQFLLLAQFSLVVDDIHVSENWHELRHSMDLTDIDELKMIHFQARRSINQQQNLKSN
jgi:hypothetical protein